jgi:hypothetical protein
MRYVLAPQCQPAAYIEKQHLLVAQASNREVEAVPEVVLPACSSQEELNKDSQCKCRSKHISIAGTAKH